jgi:hypothetical protein
VPVGPLDAQAALVGQGEVSDVVRQGSSLGRARRTPGDGRVTAESTAQSA